MQTHKQTNKQNNRKTKTIFFAVLAVGGHVIEPSQLGVRVRLVGVRVRLSALLRW